MSFITDGNVRRTYPALHMQPVGTADGVPSKWMDSKHRPVNPGNYECKFRTTGDAVLTLWWDGFAFRDRANGTRVQCVNLLAWRGWLA